MVQEKNIWPKIIVFVVSLLVISGLVYYFKYPTTEKKIDDTRAKILYDDYQNPDKIYTLKIPSNFAIQDSSTILPNDDKINNVINSPVKKEELRLINLNNLAFLIIRYDNKSESPNFEDFVKNNIEEGFLKKEISFGSNSAIELKKINEVQDRFYAHYKILWQQGDYNFILTALVVSKEKHEFYYNQITALLASFKLN